MNDLRNILTAWAVAGMAVAVFAVLSADKGTDERVVLVDPSVRAQMFRDQVPSEMWSQPGDPDERIGITIGELEQPRLSETAARRSRLIQAMLGLNISCGPAPAPGG